VMVTPFISKWWSIKIEGLKGGLNYANL